MNPGRLSPYKSHMKEKSRDTWEKEACLQVPDHSYAGSTLTEHEQLRAAHPAGPRSLWSCRARGRREDGAAWAGGAGGRALLLRFPARRLRAEQHRGDQPGGAPAQGLASALRAPASRLPAARAGPGRPGRPRGAEARPGPGPACKARRQRVPRGALSTCRSRPGGGLREELRRSWRPRHSAVAGFSGSPRRLWCPTSSPEGAGLEGPQPGHRGAAPPPPAGWCAAVRSGSWEGGLGGPQQRDPVRALPRGALTSGRPLSASLWPQRRASPATRVCRSWAWGPASCKTG